MSDPIRPHDALRDLADRIGVGGLLREVAIAIPPGPSYAPAAELVWKAAGHAQEVDEKLGALCEARVVLRQAARGLAPWHPAARPAEF